MSTTNPDLTTLSPAAVDELWAEAMQPAYAIHARLTDARRSAGRYSRKGYAVPEYLTARIADLEGQLAEAEKASAPFDAEYERRGGWARYLICVNTNGHVHRVFSGAWTSSPCPSLRPGETLVSPLFELSGKAEAEVVAELKTTACSKCFPDAPVETRETRERVTAERKAAREAEREAKRQDKLTKAAQRAEKLLAKTAAFAAKHGIHEGMDYRETYDAAAKADAPSQVFDLLLDDARRRAGERPYDRDPREVIAEVRELGLI